MTFRKLPATVDNMLKYLVKRYLICNSKMIMSYSGKVEMS